ncbi:SLATT domain-containing protein [Mycobacterium sp. PSTR-4-N]|uniref:SLATT domain-containing protein n=1 Tax=Mycobacterium sp. PSTR-4-N TaxID=2917745 RepID=UPI001F14B043|nr:SLATT domain-containing protein [Mycobacterium sp. PSTR-4-N]MCG7593727.1 SLATT domain-containing protein [Mycobacterium sp. PSTR-4-N]
MSQMLTRSFVCSTGQGSVNGEARPVNASTWTSVGLLIAIGITVLILIAIRLWRHLDHTENLDIDFAAIMQGSDARMVIVQQQIDKACEFFRLKRLRAKRASEGVVLGTLLANGIIGVIGVVVTFSDWSNLGIVSTALAGLVSGITTWEAHSRNRDLWVERTVIMSRFESLRRETYYRLAAGDDPDKVADHAMQQIEELLGKDMTEWASLRDLKPDKEKTTDLRHGDESQPQNSTP